MALLAITGPGNEIVIGADGLKLERLLCQNRRYSTRGTAKRLPGKTRWPCWEAGEAIEYTSPVRSVRPSRSCVPPMSTASPHIIPRNP